MAYRRSECKMGPRDPRGRIPWQRYPHSRTRIRTRYSEGSVLLTLRANTKKNRGQLAEEVGSSAPAVENHGATLNVWLV